MLSILSRKRLGKLIFPMALLALVLGMGWAAGLTGTQSGTGSNGQNRPGLAPVGGAASTVSNVAAGPEQERRFGVRPGDGQHAVERLRRLVSDAQRRRSNRAV